MFTLQFCLSSIGALALLKFLKSYVEWYRSPLWSLPGPPFRATSWFIGQFRAIVREPYMEPHKRWWREAGVDADWIHFTRIAGEHCVLPTNAEHVRRILASHAGRDPRYVKKLNSLLVPIVGEGLVNLEGEDWQRHRRIIHPSFQTRFVKEMLESIVPGLVNRFISYWRQAEGREIDVMEHFSNLALDVIGQVAFSHDFHALDSIQTWAEMKEDGDGDAQHVPPVTDRMMQALQEQFKFDVKKVVLAMLGLSNLDWKGQKTRKALNDAVDDILQQTRLKAETTSADDGEEGSASSSRKSKYAPSSFFETLLNAKDGGTDESNDPRKMLNDVELRDEAKTFIVAGHETTATWCFWCVFALCKHPDVQQKVYNDIVKHAPVPEQNGESTSNGTNATLSLSAVEKMQYLDAFMKEVLRMYPPAGNILRNTTRDETFGDALIPANTRIVVSIHLLHRNPRYWSDPDEFRPERWLTEDGRVQCPASRKYAFIPFSTGQRNCIGHQFATVEAKLIMAPIIRAFAFRLAPSLRDTEFKFTSFITMKAKPVVRVCLRSRSTLE